MQKQYDETRWAWVEIDLGALQQNVRTIRERIGADRILMAIVKADGCGHGAVRCGEAALQAGADRLGVATVAEGIELREAGIKAPIHLLSEPPMDSVVYLLEHRLIPTVSTQDFALALGEAADAQGIVAPFHVKIDTGMNRIGVHYSEAVQFLKSISFHRGLKHEGTMTHFATADETSDWDFNIQMTRFVEALGQMEEAGFEPGIVHAANSAAIVMHPESHFDMVRLGISLYGLHPSKVTYNHVDLKPVMSVKARATYVKMPQVGEGVGYGLTYRVPGNVQIATLPLGYADGLHRILSNKMEVLFAGRRFPQVGNICMDQTMIEVSRRYSTVSERPHIEQGDEVVIVGAQGDDQITLDEVAALAQTINYEMSCAFSLRLPRVYLQGE